MNSWVFDLGTQFFFLDEAFYVALTYRPHNGEFLNFATAEFAILCEFFQKFNQTQKVPRNSWVFDLGTQFFFLDEAFYVA